MAARKDENDLSSNSKEWKLHIGFFILGFCTYFGYAVMLSAAHDILSGFQPENYERENDPDVRYCNEQSTGLILLADIVPSMTAKIISPFAPYNVRFRAWLTIAMPFIGLYLTALSKAVWTTYIGVALISFSSGLGEATFLSYTSFFVDNVLPAWSSGTGTASIFSSAYYATLTTFLEPWKVILMCLWMPILNGFAFFVLIRKPTKPMEELSRLHSVTHPDHTENGSPSIDTIGQKLRFMFTLLFPRYMLPLAIVYFFEYFINQGLFELIAFDDIFINYKQQYRWYNFLYQFGVFISRSSVKWIRFKLLYLLTIFQAINAIYFTVEAVFYVTPVIYIVFAVIFWEGLLGGTAYVNTYYKMSEEITPDLRVFAMGFVNQADSYGISLAGLVALPVHNVICKLPKPERIEF